MGSGGSPRRRFAGGLVLVRPRLPLRRRVMAGVSQHTFSTCPCECGAGRATCGLQGSVRPITLRFVRYIPTCTAWQCGESADKNFICKFTQFSVKSLELLLNSFLEVHLFCLIFRRLDRGRRQGEETRSATVNGWHVNKRPD
jgi:hypothetical protein